MKTQCPNCKTKFKAPDEHKGKKVKCPKCNEVFVIVPFIEKLLVEVCSSCGREISRFEQIFVFDGEILCAECDRKLRSGSALKSVGLSKLKKPSSSVQVTSDIDKDVVDKGITKVSGLEDAELRTARSNEIVVGRGQKTESTTPKCPLIEPVSMLILGLHVCAFIINLAFRPLLHKDSQLEKVSEGIHAWTILLMIILGFALLYRIWAAIQFARPRTSPSKAIWGLFIPFYNIYWLFQVFWGWAKDYNNVLAQYKIKAPRMSESLGVVMGFAPIVSSVITGVIMMIMIVNRPQDLSGYIIATTVVPVGHEILFFLYYFKALDCINALAKAVTLGQSPFASPSAVVSRVSYMARCSLICGIFSILLIPAIPGLVFGIIGLHKIRKSEGSLWGKVEADVGILLSFFFLVPVIVLLIHIIILALPLS